EVREGEHRDGMGRIVPCLEDRRTRAKLGIARVATNGCGEIEYIAICWQSQLRRRQRLEKASVAECAVAVARSDEHAHDLECHTRIERIVRGAATPPRDGMRPLTGALGLASKAFQRVVQLVLQCRTRVICPAL